MFRRTTKTSLRKVGVFFTSEIRRGSISAKFAAELRKEVANDFGGGQTDSLDYYFEKFMRHQVTKDLSKHTIKYYNERYSIYRKWRVDNDEDLTLDVIN
ncbi:TPA: hypothetical protein K8938_002191 [Staphylococcus pseudintermedius]|nr:hypothetical protein [Staphylococcus pseudintermedius]EJD5653721.1 hypothetical protein [Staphylococcus pseudintermedius]HCA7429423.1 hypothetical protein [Staphylococcus pseudintermedius]